VANVKKFVLREGVTTSADAQVVADLPGLWAPGVAQRPEAFGLTYEEFAAMVAEQNAPLDEVSEPETLGDTEPWRDPNENRAESAPDYGTEVPTAELLAAEPEEETQVLEAAEEPKQARRRSE
jgi:hypothetical protein